LAGKLYAFKKRFSTPGLRKKKFEEQHNSAPYTIASTFAR
jgi:hypothetical protein